MVVFVEFVDGAKYGSSDWGEYLSEGRAATIERLKGLLKAYQGGGEGALRMAMTQALTRPDNPSYTQDALYILDEKLKAAGAEGFISNINEKLRAAQERTNVM
jgi:hypothetical protein